MPTSSSAAREFGAISSPASAATPALAARKGSLPSWARASRIASAIGLRQTLALHTKSTFLGCPPLAPPSLNRLLPPAQWLFPYPLDPTLPACLLVACADGTHYTDCTPFRRNGWLREWVCFVTKRLGIVPPSRAQPSILRFWRTNGLRAVASSRLQD